MAYNAAAVEALVAIADHGTFEAAARALHVTPSAVSQRIRALEREVGRVVVRRGTPCEPTEAGAALVRLGRQARCSTTRPGPRSADDAGRVEVDRRGQRRLAGDLVPRRARRGRRPRRPRAAARRRGPGLLRRAAAQRRGAGRGDQRPAAGPGLPVGAPRLPALPAGRDAGAGRALAQGQRPRLAADAGRRLQREGRRSSTTCCRDRGVDRPGRRAPRADQRRLPRGGPAAAWAGACCPSRSCYRTSTPARLVTLGGRTHHDVHLHWQRWRIDSAPWHALTDAVRPRRCAAR